MQREENFVSPFFLVAVRKKGMFHALHEIAHHEATGFLFLFRQWNNFLFLLRPGRSNHWWNNFIFAFALVVFLRLCLWFLEAEIICLPSVSFRVWFLTVSVSLYAYAEKRTFFVFSRKFLTHFPIFRDRVEDFEPIVEKKNKTLSCSE